MLNNLCISGRFVRDINLKQTSAGTNVINVPIACDRYSNGQKTTDFFDIVAFGNNAKFISEHFAKGDSIIIIGRLQARTWTTDAGENRKAIEIVVNSVEFTGGRTSANNESSGTNSSDRSDVPFEV